MVVEGGRKCPAAPYERKGPHVHCECGSWRGPRQPDTAIRDGSEVRATQNRSLTLRFAFSLDATVSSEITDENTHTRTLRPPKLHVDDKPYMTKGFVAPMAIVEEAAKVTKSLWNRPANADEVQSACPRAYQGFQN